MNFVTQSDERKRRLDAGGAIIVAILFAAATGIMVGSFLSVCGTNYRLALQSSLSNAALNLAEAGAEHAMWAYRNEDWSSWLEQGTFATQELTDVDLGSGTTGEFRVVVDDYEYEGTGPSIMVEGKVKTEAGLEAYKQIRIELGGRDGWKHGVVAKRTLDVSGGTASFASYDSSLGPPDPLINRSDNISVNTKAVEDGALNLGNAEVYGYLNTGGGTEDNGPTATVYGEDWVAGDPLLDSERVGYEFEMFLPSVDEPTMSAGAGGDSDPDISYFTRGGAPGSRTISGGTSDSPVEYHLTSFEMSQNKEMIVGAYSYVTNPQELSAFIQCGWRNRDNNPKTYNQ